MRERTLATEATAEAPLVRRSHLNLSTPWAEPRTEGERKVAAIWRKVLGIDAVGGADDFFDLGGDSFAAAELAAAIETTFSVQFAPSDIISLSTVAKQADYVASKASGLVPELPSHLVLGCAGGSKSPVFMVHGGHGYAFFRPEFIDEVGRDRAVYLFQAPGLDGRAPPLESIEEFAALYVDTIRRIQPSGPYNIVAMCAGSFIALEMCHRLTEVGERVAHLVLLDPPVSPPSVKARRAEMEGQLPNAARPRIKSALSQIVGALRGANGGPAQKPTRAYKRNVKMQRVVERLRRSADESAEQAAYAIETRARVVELLKEALDKHVPRPYAGNATMLVRSVRADKMSNRAAFWPNHVGDLKIQVCETDRHLEVFKSHLGETARFVSASLT